MPALIRFKEADLGYGQSLILRGVNCVIERGESVGLVGQNGSGKTTFLRGVLGLIPPLSGKLEVDSSQCFAYVPQMENLNFYLPLTVREAVYLTARAKRFLGGITAMEKLAAESAMERVGINEIANKLIRECSGGQRQKTILAQAISQKPDVLLLDEPTKGLDVIAERDLLSLIDSIKKERDLTLLLVTHSLHIPLNHMEKIFLFCKQSLIPTTPDELIHTKKLEQIYGATFLHHEFDGFRWVQPLKQEAL